MKKSLLLIALAVYVTAPMASEKAEIISQGVSLQRIVSLLKDQHLADYKLSVKDNSSEWPDCPKMLRDLIQGKEFAELAPRAKLVDRDKPYEGTTAAPELRLSKDQSKAYEQCLKGEPEQTDSTLAGETFSGIGLNGANPPYLVYLLNSGLSPVSGANLIYWGRPDSFSGRAGMPIFVHLSSCQEVWLPNGGFQSDWLEKDPDGNAAALAVYMGKITYVEVSRGRHITIHRITPAAAPNKPSAGSICSWTHP